MRAQNNLVVAIYFHPEAYPPTLNAVGELSECYDHISLVHRPHLKTEWQFPDNVSTFPSGTPMTAREQEQAPTMKKIGFFLQFLRDLLRICRRSEPSMILLYDSMALFAYQLIRPMLKTHKAWYHNHDVSEWQSMRRYSIGWFAGKTEAKAFPRLDIFSLPSNERKKYFPLDRFKGKYFFLPNYPAKRFYDKFYRPKETAPTIRLIFQGAIGPFHGIEEIIPMLNEEVRGHRLELVLKGPCLPEHREKYLNLAASHNVSERLSFVGVTSYGQVPATASTCHIGIGILAKSDLMNTTLGTASNKLYEYAAVGLPVIYYDHANFTAFLSRFEWAFPAALTTNAIRNAIFEILPDYSRLSLKAHEDFEKQLNYETAFRQVKDYLGCQTSKSEK